MSQNDQILQYLKVGKTITATQAISLFSCYRLAARIKDLKNKGIQIESKFQVQNSKKFSVYALKDKK